MGKTNAPRVLVSECLGFSACRFDGSMFKEKFIEDMKKYVCFIPVCPEIEIGLTVPREVLRLYDDKEQTRLYQPKTMTDFTEDMKSFANQYLDSTDVEGAILKTKSPSCALKDAKVYPNKDSNITSRRSSGLFSEILQAKYPNLPVEDDGRLTNKRIRENFLTAIFTLNRFKKIKVTSEVKYLLEFHGNHKYLFMCYNEEKMRELGRLLAHQTEFSQDELFQKYEQGLYEIFSKRDNPGKKVNVLLHMLGFFKDQVTRGEKVFLLETIEKYRDNQMPLSVPISILKSWAIKYKEKYLLSQYLFSPYPQELMSLEDSSKSS